MRSTVTSESGIFDYSSTSYQPPASPTTSWRNNLTTSVVDDGTRVRDYTISVDSTPRATSQYSRRQTPPLSESLSQSTYKTGTDSATNESIYQHPTQSRTVRRQIAGSPPNEYESLTSFRSGSQLQGKVPITTESRSRKPLVVDEVETVETETRVECQVARTNESEETSTPRKKIVTKPTPSARSPSEDLISSRRVLLNERPQYYESYQTRGTTLLSSFVTIYLAVRLDSSLSESIPNPSTRELEDPPIRVEETWFKPIKSDRRQQQSSTPTFHTSSRTLQVTSLSPESQVVFGKHSANEIIAIVRIPEWSRGASGQHVSTASHLSRASKFNEIRSKSISNLLQQQQHTQVGVSMKFYTGADTSQLFLLFARLLLILQTSWP